RSANIFFELTRKAKENNLLVAANPGINQFKVNVEEFKKALVNIDILTLNNSEAEELFGLLNTQSYSVENYFKEISKCGPKIIAVTDGANGVYAFQNNIIYFHASIKTEKLVNTLGAGDAFGSCFVASILSGKSIEEALIAGILNSSSVISKEGAKSGLLTSEQLEKKMKNVKIELVKTKI
ncbi:MAG: carbohydrate kinase family protein, partial [Candidatus Babeliales bacterium]|nr:carbohydrate kinase family protein [Candidatus Babeliales bacterium]